MNSIPSLSLLEARRKRRWLFSWLVAGWLLVMGILDIGWLSPTVVPVELDVELDSSVSSVAQAFFDTGKGFTEDGCATVPVVAGPGSIILPAPLTPNPISAVRFDPLTVAGTVHLRRAYFRRSDTQQELYSIDLGKITARNEIARLELQPNGLEVVTTPDSGDSQLNFPLASPLSTNISTYQRVVRWAEVDLGATLLAVVAIGLAIRFWPRMASYLRPVAAPVLWVDRRFAAWAARLSRPEIARLDHWVFWFYGACFLAFGGMAAGGLHGLSLDEYSAYSALFPWSDVQTAPLFGHPQSIRSDEWAQETPAILNQAFRKDAYAAKTSSCGGQSAALLFSLPCRDFTEALRPQFWAFHFLPISSAMSIYWQVRGFLFLTGLFSLLLLLTRGRSGLAALGAVWLFFSANMQWSYSWPTMLPEMVGCFAWTICLTLYMTVGQNRYGLAAAAAGCIFTSVNFALCLYPPHQIPFILFGALLVPAWVWTQRSAVFQRNFALPRLLALVACWGIVALLMTGFVLEAKGAVTAAANTIYPGQRLVSGGGVPLAEFVSHFLDFWKSDTRYPSAQGNICEGTGFLWLLPVTMFMLGKRSATGPTPSVAVLIVCWVVTGLLVTWMIFPIPPEIGHWLFLDHVLARRCLPALGVINVVGVIICFAWRTPQDLVAVEPVDFQFAATCLAIFLGATALLSLANTVYQGFFYEHEIILGAVYAAVLVVCLRERCPAAFAGALLVPLVLANGLVNPVDRGLRVITDSAFYRAVQDDPHLREDRWLVYSHDVSLPGFVLATGVNVFNSFKVVPNLRDLRAFDPDNHFLSVYNRGGFTIARPLPVGQPCNFELENPGLQVWSVSPLDPALRAVGVRYVVFDELPDATVAASLKRIVTDVPKIFVYELP